MSTKTSLFDIGLDGIAETKLEILTLDGNTTPIIPFTADGQKVTLHYVDDPQMRGYVHCNGDGCVACRIGREGAEKLLLPVYHPLTRRVMVLPVSMSLRPGGLLPQLQAAMKSPSRSALFINRVGNKYTVTAKALGNNVDDGAAVIKAYLDKDANDASDLAVVYPKLTNDQLVAIGSIAQLLALQGGNPL